MIKCFHWRVEVTSVGANPHLLPWWVDRLLIPIIFVLVGAGITFATAQIAGWRERHRAKRAFLQAIRLELRGLEEQLQASLKEIQDSKARLERGVAAPPHLVGTLRTTVFASQLGRISDLSDPVIFEIIKLYSDLAIVPQVVEALNQHSKELSKDEGIAQQAQKIRAVLSIVIALTLQYEGFVHRIRNLISALPS
jgi:hypothetical protein